MPDLVPSWALQTCKNRAKFGRHRRGSGICPRHPVGTRGAVGQRCKERFDPELCHSLALGPWRMDFSGLSLNFLLKLLRGEIYHPGLARTKRGNAVKGRFWGFHGVYPTRVASHSSWRPLSVVPVSQELFAEIACSCRWHRASPAETNRHVSPRGAPRLTPGIDVGADVIRAFVKLMALPDEETDWPKPATGHGLLSDLRKAEKSSWT